MAKFNATGLHLILAVLGFCIAIGIAQKHAPISKYCPYVYDCPDECDEIIDERGCPRCICGVPFYRAPRPQCLKNRRGCSPMCQEILDANGCSKCICGLFPFYRWPRPKPTQRIKTNFVEHKLTESKKDAMNETDDVLDVRQLF